MKPLPLYLLETLFCSGLLLAFYRLLLVRKVGFGSCRRFLVAAVLLSALLPALDIPLYPARTVVYPLPLIGMEESVVPVAAAAAETAQATAAPTASVEWPRVVRFAAAALCMAATLVLLALFVARLTAIRRLRRRSALTDCGDYRLAENPEVTTPFSFLRTVFLGEGFAGRRREMVLCHEASHVRRRHSVERILVELVCCFYWFNPFVWIASRWLREVQEWEADSDVLAAGYDLTEYRSVIFCQLFGYNPDIACGLNRSLTKTRFAMMTRFKERHFALVRLGAAIPVVAGMMLLCSFRTRLPEQEAPAATVFPGLENMTRTEVLRSEMCASIEGKFGYFAYLPADDAKYRAAGTKILTPSGQDISQWAWKHYRVMAENPMFAVDGELLSKEQFAERESRRFGNTPNTVKEQIVVDYFPTIYAGPEVGKLVGDASVDVLMVISAGKPAVGTVSVVRIGPEGRITFNGRKIDPDSLAAYVAAEREKLSEADRARMEIRLVADPGQPIGTIDAARQALRKAHALRVRYAMPSGEVGVQRMLPPEPGMSEDGKVRVVEVMPTVRERNLFLVLVNDAGLVMAGQPGRQRVVEKDELPAMVEAFILNESDDADGPEKVMKDIPRANGTTDCYPVSEGVVSLLVDRKAPYAAYIEVQRALQQGFVRARDAVAKRWLGASSYEALSDADRKAVDRAVPIKIAEAEAVGTVAK